MSTEELTMDDQLTTTAMTIILCAGDARSAVRKAYDALAAGNREVAVQQMATAQDAIKKAHQAQTEVIQAEAGGAELTLTLLFSHAQDTLMTINSEVITAGNLLAVFDSFDRRLAALEAKEAQA